MTTAAIPNVDVVEAIASLARHAKSSVEFRPLPPEIVPPGSLIQKPHVAIITGADGDPKIVDLKQYVDSARGKPARRVGVAKVKTVDSFIDLINRHKNEASAIFVDAEWREPNLLAVIDYHATAAEDSKSTPGEDALARDMKHRIAYHFPLSDPWKQWLAGDLTNSRPPNWMSQEDFARFLENHIHEIASPTVGDETFVQTQFKTKLASANQMLDLARGLEINVESNVKAKTRLASGETQIVFETTHKNGEGGEIDVPGMFMIAVPLFYGSDLTRLCVRLRYRVNGGIVWGYEIHRPDIVIDEAVRIEVNRVANDTLLPTYDGAPEA